MELQKDIIIVAGPVIIENNQVLLNREIKPTGETLFFFPGGRVENFDENLEDACRREIKEEMGIEIKIIRPLRTLLKNRVDDKGKVLLLHYLAQRIGEIKPGKDIVEWGWYDINNLPANCAPNVYEIIKDLKS